MKIFLGGTCNGSKWREELIPMLNCDYFNPVVDDSHRRKFNTIFCFIRDGFSDAEIKSLAAVEKLLAKNGVTICHNLENVAYVINLINDNNI